MSVLKKIFNYEAVVICMLAVLVQVPFLDKKIPVFHTLYMYGSLVITCFLIVLQILTTKVKKDYLWIVLFYGTIFYTTIRGSGMLYDYVRSNFASLAVCILFYLWLNNNPKVLINSLSFLQVYVYINLLTIILFRTGMYADTLYKYYNWFLGYKNIHIRTILPVLACDMIRSYYKYNRCCTSTKVLIGASILTFLLNGSSTSLVGIGIFLLLVFMYHKNNKPLPKLLSLKSGLVFAVLFFILIVVMRMQNMFSFLIVDILGKDLTLHNRTKIWDRTFALMEKNSVFGYGYVTGTKYGELMNNDFFAHPHNFFLYVAFMGGIVLVAVLILGYLHANRVLKNTNESIYSKIILFTLLAFLIMGLTESLTGTVFFYPMLILAMNVDKIITQDAFEQPERIVNIFLWNKTRKRMRKRVLKRISFTK